MKYLFHNIIVSPAETKFASIDLNKIETHKMGYNDRKNKIDYISEGKTLSNLTHLGP